VTRDKRVFIGMNMYRAYPKSSKEWSEFEAHRHKEVHLREHDHGDGRILGPFLSIDRQWIIYSYEF
jgi:hypothetical protein